MSFQATLELNESQERILYEVFCSKRFRIYQKYDDILIYRNKTNITITCILERELKDFLYFFLKRDRSIDDELIINLEGDFEIDFTLLPNVVMPRKKFTKTTVNYLRQKECRLDWK